MKTAKAQAIARLLEKGLATEIIVARTGASKSTINRVRQALAQQSCI